MIIINEAKLGDQGARYTAWAQKLLQGLRKRALFRDVDFRHDWPIAQTTATEASDTFFFCFIRVEFERPECLMLSKKWTKAAGGIEDIPKVSIFGPRGKTLPNALSLPDIPSSVEMIEALALQPSYQHAVAYINIAFTPPIEGKKHYISQSLKGFSLCRASSSGTRDLGAYYGVYGIGQPFAADGEVFERTLYWCGTFSYETRGGMNKTVPRYALEMSTAVEHMRKQLYPNEEPETEPSISAD